MTRKFVSLITAVALICGLCATPAFARSGSDSKESAENEKAPPVGQIAANEKLKADVAKLVADAKAGKLKMPTQHFPQSKRNNLSTGAKVAIIAGIGAAVFLIWLLVTLADDDS